MNRCTLVDFIYFRFSGRGEWYLNAFRYSDDEPEQRTPGYLGESRLIPIRCEGLLDVVGLGYAVPCSDSGEVNSEILAEYEDMADEEFKRQNPTAELA